ncbi:MAG: class II aldolase/adducin family protein [bacterium]
MHQEYDEICQIICEIGKRLYRFGHVVANDGNISVRVADDVIATTPTGVCKGDMSPEMMVFVDPEGEVLSEGKPSSEIPMHLFIYRHRPEIRAVVHAHPVHATAFATAGITLDRCVLAEIVTTIGSIPIAPYGTPSTEELPETLRPFVQDHEAILLANHGAVTMGRDPWEAYFKLERVEHYAKIIYISRILGGEKALPKQEVEKLFGLRAKYGIEAVNPGCKVEVDDDSGCEHHTHSQDLSAAAIDRIVDAVVDEVRPYLMSK